MSLVYLDLFIICSGVGFIMYNVYNNFNKKEEESMFKLEADYEDYLYVENSEKPEENNKTDYIYIDGHLIKKRKRKDI
jgi:uncharacterized protein YsxB (DUF464 family)